MVTRPTLTLACGKYDRTDAIREGRVLVEGAQINYLALPPHEIFWRMLKYEEFDACEMSLASYLISREQGRPGLVAIPVFPSRIFRHGNIFVHDRAGINRPEDLRGRKVGVPEYEITAALWVRGFLWHDYGVSPADMSWWVSREEKYQLAVSHLQITKIAEGKNLEGMLLAGEIDALIQTGIPRELGAGISRLFPNYREVEMDYFRRTGIFPIMHTLVIRGDVHSRYPWLARSLYKAFVEAKNLCLREMYQTSALRYTMPWMVAEIEAEWAVLGADPWPYGLDANRATLEAAVAYALEQGLIRGKPDVEEIFLPVEWTNEPTAKAIKR